MRLLLEINNNKSKDLPCSVVDSLCRWWWWWWCPCSSVDWCSSTIAVDGSVESLWLNVRNRYDPCALSSSFPFEKTPFRPAVHTNTNNMSNAMILNTANIDDNCCRDRVVIFVSRSLSLSFSRFVCVCARVFNLCLFALLFSFVYSLYVWVYWWKFLMFWFFFNELHACVSGCVCFLPVSVTHTISVINVYLAVICFYCLLNFGFDFLR